MPRRLLISFIALLAFTFSNAQTKGIVSGVVVDKTSQLPIKSATVSINKNNITVQTDDLGKFRIADIPVNTYTLTVSAVGYSDQIIYNLIITSGNETVLNIEMERMAKALSDITITARKNIAKVATLESPLSIQRLTTEEIKSNPGGNFDISRVVQSLPGVAGTAGSVGGYRNDIILRGGAPNENVYYLDGFEVPVINHFATQGSAGGPTGILNVSFIEDVKLSTSAFDARYDNALSGVLQFKQKKGNPNRLQGNLRLSGTELALTAEGPLSKNKQTTFLASARRSYLQFLFKALDLPIRPDYWDFQYKINHTINSKTSLTFIGIGAIDEFGFAKPRKATPEKLYILSSVASIEQWNYTVGAGIKHLLKNGYLNLTLSRNVFNNALDQFDDNDPVESKRKLKIRSQETENKLRLDVNLKLNDWSLSYGAMIQQLGFDNSLFNRFRAEVKDENGNTLQPAVIIQSNANINFWKFGAFIQTGRTFFNNKLGISAGIRTDMNSFTDDGMNALRSFSPRISLSYVLSNKLTLNTSAGSYYKIPPYTILGFADAAGNFVNKDARYIGSHHLALGIEYLPRSTTRFTLEAFYKKYDHYPVSVRDGISLANLGGDFGVVGKEDIVSTGKGRAYGIEFFAQQKLTKHFFGILSYTFVYSSFSGVNGKYVPSSWDNRHLLSLTAGYKFKRNWELGIKFRYQGGAPYTPFNETLSQLNYLSLGTGILDYSQLNTKRLKAFHASDIRIDKKWNFRRTTLDVFLDVTNWYAAKNPAYPNYTFKRTDDNSSFLTTDGQAIKQDGSNAIPYLLSNEDATVIPTIGFIIEF